jgi:hypothetical protein
MIFFETNFLNEKRGNRVEVSTVFAVNSPCRTSKANLTGFLVGSLPVQAEKAYISYIWGVFVIPTKKRQTKE